MSDVVSAPDPIFLFRSEIEKRRFDDVPLRILESLLVSKDVPSLLQTRSALKEFMRCETVSVLKSIEGKSVDDKLYVVDFLVRAFHLLGDTESCLALKYEALTFRELKHMDHAFLHVSCEEWLTFAEDSCHSGFSAIAVKGYENALLCIPPINPGPEHSLFYSNRHLEAEIRELRDKTRSLVSSESVQAQTAEYLRKKFVGKNQRNTLAAPSPRTSAISMYRGAIKKRNQQKLKESQKLQNKICSS